MRKIITIWLVLWLPLFMATANAMSLEMEFAHSEHTQLHAQVNKHLHTSENNFQVHARCHAVHEQGQLPDSQHHGSEHCATCCICALSSAIANLTLPIVFIPSNIRPQLFDVAFTSQDYPPAIKPPILN